MLAGIGVNLKQLATSCTTVSPEASPSLTLPTSLGLKNIYIEEQKYMTQGWASLKELRIWRECHRCPEGYFQLCPDEQEEGTDSFSDAGGVVLTDQCPLPVGT